MALAINSLPVAGFAEQQHVARELATWAIVSNTSSMAGAEPMILSNFIFGAQVRGDGALFFLPLFALLGHDFIDLERLRDERCDNLPAARRSLRSDSSS